MAYQVILPRLRHFTKAVKLGPKLIERSESMVVIQCLPRDVFVLELEWSLLLSQLVTG